MACADRLGRNRNQWKPGGTRDGTAKIAFPGGGMQMKFVTVRRATENRAHDNENICITHANNGIGLKIKHYRVQQTKR